MPGKEPEACLRGTELVHCLKEQWQVKDHAHPSCIEQKVAKVASEQAPLEDDTARRKGFRGQLELNEQEEREERKRQAEWYNANEVRPLPIGTSIQAKD